VWCPPLAPPPGRFKQGATIVPRNLYFVSGSDLAGALEPDRSYWVETDEEQAKTAKKAYRNIRLRGNVEGEFIYSVPLSKHVLPFLMLDAPDVVLPINHQGSILSAKELKAAGWRGMGAWMAKADAAFKEGQKTKKRLTALQRIDYQHGLTSQSFNSGYLVLYNAAGKNISACVVNVVRAGRRFKVDHKLYWCHCTSESEAYYLGAILNSRAVNEAIKPFQSRGLLGERDVHKKVLELPIPSFNETIDDHRKLAAPR
jgi:hypothetical protein